MRQDLEPARFKRFPVFSEGPGSYPAGSLWELGAEQGSRWVRALIRFFRDTLTIGKQLALKSDATYLVTVKSSTPAADLVVANGIRIIGAQIVFNEVSSAVLPPGTMLTLIGNTSSKPISGTFANLPDGGTVTIGSNTFQANYEGGDGNDLTLTVEP